MKDNDLKITSINMVYFLDVRDGRTQHEEQNEPLYMNEIHACSPQLQNDIVPIKGDGEASYVQGEKARSYAWLDL